MPKVDADLIQPVAKLIMAAGPDAAQIRTALEQAGRKIGNAAALTALIDAAKRWLIESAAAHDEIGYEIAINRLEALYAKCNAANDARMALAVQHELNRLRAGRSETAGPAEPGEADADPPAGPFDFKTRFREQMRRQRSG